jgi:hypothetical protein
MKDITDYLEKEQVDCMMAAAKTCNFRDYLMLSWSLGILNYQTEVFS